MRIKHTFLALLAAGLLSPALAQNHRGCGTMDHLHTMQQQDPTVKTRLEQVERESETWIQNQSSNQRSTVVITIPVVVHVVYNTVAENVSDAQIQSQINILNQDFRKLNTDINLVPGAFAGLAADCEIQFCLAQRDPSGNASTGIVRRSSTVTSFSSNDNMKFTSSGGSDAWPYTSYLNMWVCDLGSGLLGYATFPGTATSTDGVVMDYAAFGNIGSAAAPFNKGRTATHEIGHWLNLRHIWGDANCGNDQVTDTPTQQTSNYGCPTFPKVTCSNGPNGDMFMNYMDYTDDACMYMFTTGQKTRMVSSLNSSPRSSLLSSLGCVPPGPSCGTPANLAASAITDTTAVITWGTVSGATTYSVQYRPAGSTFWNVSNSASNSVVLGGLTLGTSYEYQVRATCGTVVGNYSASSFFSTTNSLCPTPTGLAATSITTSGATLSWTAVSGATGYNVVYRVSGSTTSVTLSVLTNSATLTGLTAATAYSYTVQAICSGSTSAVSATASFTTQAGSCTDTYESNESRTTAKVIPLNTDISARIGTSTDKDWFRFATVSGATNLRVVLDQLPADYELELYSSSGKRLARSINSGTTTETITRNTNTASTYYVQVFGYAGAFNANLCYRLRANTSGTAFRTSNQAEASDEIAVQAEKITTADLFQVFPNPASNDLNVRYFSEANTDITIEIVDMLGKTIYTNRFTSEEGFNTTNIQLNDFNNGIYFVRLNQSGSSEIRKFIVKH
ncbi:MAG: fibronectin type III domain-containing protein [Bacteroidota bacterium]|jgi:hypothetical protein